MSKEIDEKVVEMRFDNSHFEKNVQTSISSLDKLRRSLDLGGAARGLDEISSSAEDSSSALSGFTAGVEAIGKKFTALEVVAITALANITNSVVNLGKQMVSSLTIDQIMAGFSKYENKTTAVQTIVNATGKSLEEVNAQLDKLNWFTDETSYSFTDMVSNIGKFTSMGIDLETSVTAMMGIANWAAVSGQGVNEASRAMYNLAQSIGVGAVKLQDWKSIENANMATKEFKEIAIDTAKALGILDEEAKTAGGTLVTAENFSSTLSEGWFTSDVLLAALGKYGNYAEEVYKVASEEGLTAAEAMEKVGNETMELGSKAFKAAQEAKTFTDAINATKDAVSTGWMNTFEILFGNYEEARRLWTDLANEMYDIFASGAEGRNELLSEWKELGGRTKLVEAFYNALTILKNVIQTVKDSFRDIFPAKTAEQLYTLTEAFYNFTERVKNNDKPLENMKRVLKGFFAVLDIGKQLFTSLLKVLSPLLKVFGGAGGSIFDMSASFGDFLVRLDDTIRKTEIFDKAFGGIARVIINFTGQVRKLLDAIKNSKIFLSFSSLLTKTKSALINFLNAAKEKFTTPGFELLHSLLERIGQRAEQLGVIFSKVKDVVIKALSVIADAISASVILGALNKIWGFIVAIAKCVGGVLADAFSLLAEKLNAGDFKGILDVINSISLVGIAVGIKKFFDTVTGVFDGADSVLANIKGVLDGVRQCFEAYQKKIKAQTLYTIAKAIAILVASIVILSTVDSDKVTASTVVIGALFGALLTAMSILTKINGKASKANKTTAAMLGMSVSVLILASALKSVSSLNPREIVVGLAGVAGLMAILVVATKAMSKGSKTIMKGAAQLVIFGLAIRVLASACKTMSKLSWGEMSRGLVGVGALMAEIAVFLNIAKFNKKSLSTAAGMVLLGAAIKILASACKTFSGLSWGGIEKGLLSVGALLLELSAFSRIVSPNKMLSTGLGLVAISAAIKILSTAIIPLSKLSWDSIAKGLVAMALSLAAITVALKFMPKDIVGTGLGLIAAATAILILGSALNKVTDISWESVAKGLIALSGSLAVLAVGLHAMKGTIAGSASLLLAANALLVLIPVLSLMGKMSWKTILKSLASLAAIFAVVGIAALALTPIAPALLSLSAALALVGVSVLALGVGLLALSAACTALATAGVAMASGLVAALNVIVVGVAQMIPLVANLLAQGVIEFARVIGEGAPVIAECVSNVLQSLLTVIYESGPQLVNTLVYLVTCALQTLAEYSPQIVQALFDILIACLKGIADNIGLVVQTAVDVVVAFLNGIASKLPDVIQAGFDLIISFINGLATAIENNSQRLVDASWRLIKAIIDAMINFLTGSVTNFLDIGKNIISGLWEGIKSGASALWDGIKEIGNGIKDFFCNLFGIHSPSTVFAEYGKYMDAGLALGLRQYAGKVEASTEQVGESAMSGMSDAVSQISDLVENDEFGEPTIRPVIDLSGIQNGANQIGQMMGKNYELQATMAAAQNTARSMSSGRISEDKTMAGEFAKMIQKIEKTAPVNNSNTFYISGNNPKEIAEEVARVIDSQMQRRKASWG